MPFARTPGTPTATRTLLLLAIAGAGPVAARPAAAERIDEAAVIRLARARDPDLARAEAAAAAAEAAVLTAGLHPDPELAATRESVAGAREDTLALTVPLAIVGRRPAARLVARSAALRARAEAARAERDAVAGALVAFYQAIAADRRAAIAREAAAGLAEASRVLASRRRAGQASGHEESRLLLAAELARSAEAEAEGEARAARAELAAWLGLEERDLELAGQLAPAAPPPAGGVPREVALAREAAGVAGRARAAARWSVLPTLSITGGLRVVDDGESRTGYVAGLALALPIFSRGRDARAEARAAELQATAAVRAGEAEARRREGRAGRALAASLAELRRFEQATAGQLERLLGAARSGYQEGELSLRDLLDAEETAAAIRRRAVELELAARRAEVALRAARGQL